jgi:hypothetical protein
MNVQHAHTRKVGCGGHRACNRIRNVVKLQVEENISAQTRQLSNSLRALGCEELLADFEKPSYAAKLPRQGVGRPQAVNIQGND